MKRLAIFAGYDKYNIIDDYVLFYLKELKKISDIIYIADCEMPETELNKIKDYTIKAISEKHREYDFGSYKRGYIYAKENNILENYDYLILCNDSVYGPFFSLEELFNKMKDYKFGGLYKSKDIKIANHYYIGSFFIVIKKEIFSSDIFSNFIISVKKEADKIKIIKNYEFGISKLMIDSGINIEGRFMDKEISNRPYFEPLKLLDEGFPFIKKHILEKKITVPLNIEELKLIIQKIKKIYDINMIVNNLNRNADANQIKYLFQRFKPFNYNFINNKLLNIFSRYSPSGKYQIVFKFFNKIFISLDIPISFSYIKSDYKNFNFLIDL